MIKMIFNYLDSDKDGQITFKDFRILDGDNWRKIDDYSLTVALLEIKRRQASPAAFNEKRDSKPSVKTCHLMNLKSFQNHAINDLITNSKHMEAQTTLHPHQVLAHQKRRASLKRNPTK